MNEKIEKIIGRYVITFDDIVVESNNLVVNSGHDQILRWSVEDTDSFLNTIAVGIGATTASAGDTTLEHQIAYASITYTAFVNHQAIFRATFAAGEGTGHWAEIGAFSGDGNMFDRTVLSPSRTKASTAIAVTQLTLEVS